MDQNEKKSSGTGGKNLWVNAVIVILLCMGIAAAFILKNRNLPEEVSSEQTMEIQVPLGVTDDASPETSLPRLVDLGSDICIPCKMMAPILEELSEEYKDALDIELIDVRKNQGAATEYAISLIPTQIFFDASGNELFRHEGFFSKEEILNKWEELGIHFEERQEDEKDQ